MIRIQRGKEISELAAARKAGLKELRKIVKTRKPEKGDFKGYDVAKDTLWRRQKFKCCYCEHKEPLTNRDVEHFRPKTRVDRSPHPSGKGTGYWWLAWSWNNLMFSCDGCNRFRKNARFPLDPNSDVLNAEEDPSEEEFSKKETPLLVDPAIEDAIEHIQFRPLPDGKWQPFPRGGSERGRQTIEVCGLDRPDLLDLYEDYVARYVSPRIADLQKALGAEDGIETAWKRAVELVATSMEFAALAYDVLDHHVPEAVRNRFGLGLPVPSA